MGVKGTPEARLGREIQAKANGRQGTRQGAEAGANTGLGRGSVGARPRSRSEPRKEVGHASHAV